MVWLLNFSLFGQDLLTVGVEAKLLHGVFTDDIQSLIVVAQAWSVGAELLLYGLAAVTFHRKAWILFSLCICVLLRLILEYVGLTDGPWGNKFILDIAVFFSLGGCSYLIYARTRHWPYLINTAIAAVGCGATLALCYQYEGFWPPISNSATLDGGLIALYCLLAVTIPFLFRLTEKSTFDRFLGELSYPIYLVHLIFFALLTWLGLGHEASKPAILIATFITGVIIVLFVERPISNIRHLVSSGSSLRVIFTQMPLGDRPHSREKNIQQSTKS